MADFSVSENKIRGLPNPLASPEVKKSYEYGLAYAQGIWQNELYARTTNWQRKMRDIINRKYAEGLESIDKYKDRLDVAGDTSFMNLDYSPTNRIAGIVDNIVGRLMNIPYKIQCTVIDPSGKVKEDEYKNRLYGNMYLKPLSDMVEKTTGIPLVPKGEKVPESDEEAELYMQINYKQAEAIAMELALDFVFYNNDWEYQRKKILRDLVVLKKGAAFRYYDSDHNICCKWQDPVDVIVPYSKHDDFRNVPYQGIISKVTIGELAQMTDEFSEEQLFEIAKGAGTHPFRTWNWGTSYEGYYRNNSGYFGREYDDFNITILNFFFLAPEDQKYTEKPRKNGGIHFDKQRSDYNIEEGSKKKLHNKKIQVRYEGFHIPGTKYIWGYKKSKNQDRAKENGNYSPKTELPLIMIWPDIFDMENKSLVERMIPHEDQINLIHLKAQQFLIEATPPGLSIDISALEGAVAAMGQGTMKPMDLIKMRKQTGDQLTSSVRADGTPILNSRPVDILPGGLGATFVGFIQAYNHELQLINDVINFNSAVDASSPDKDTLVGVQKLAAAGALNALRPLHATYVTIVERLSFRISLMVQDKCEYGEGIKGWYPAIGKEAGQIIDMGKEMAINTFGIKVQLLPDEEEKAQIMGDMALGQQTGMLKPSDVVMIREVLKSNVKLAAQMLILREKKNLEEASKAKAEDSQNNAQQQVMSSKAASESQVAAEQQITAMKAQLLQLEYQLKGQLSSQEHTQEMQKTALQNQGKVQVAETTHEGNLGLEAFRSTQQESTPNA